LGKSISNHVLNAGQRQLVTAAGGKDAEPVPVCPAIKQGARHLLESVFRVTRMVKTDEQMPCPILTPETRL